jgi:hypothetical protein
MEAKVEIFVLRTCRRAFALDIKLLMIWISESIGRSLDSRRDGPTGTRGSDAVVRSSSAAVNPQLVHGLTIGRIKQRLFGRVEFELELRRMKQKLSKRRMESDPRIT